ncbi:hypothetical protein G6F50_016810 [Rhizopus delemar]|uniref:Uncharacterized protein n=1 Tax=Rhizopus delemar TaxID=936053 RepID=A0A9P6XRT8_9FUNG|nr:hypothetical protein G6F50_016810 [Rhizopus delemar]
MGTTGSRAAPGPHRAGNVTRRGGDRSHVELELELRTVALLPLDGDVEHEKHIPEPAVHRLAAQFQPSGHFDVALPRSTGDGHGQLEAGFLSHVGHVHHDAVLDRLGAGVGMDKVEFVKHGAHLADE